MAEGRAVPASTISLVTNNSTFNMVLFLEKFAYHTYEIFSRKDIDFIERECRLLFISYLSPFINGNGFYHLESEIRENKRTDVIIDYNTEQFIVELKLWRGEVAHEKAYEQLAGYLSSKNKDTGYLLTFDFRKEKNVGKFRINWIEFDQKKICDVIVGLGTSAT